MYELIERKTASLVGTYPDLDIALLVVLETARVSGDQAIDDVVLGEDDPTGETDGQIVASGAALLKMARERYDQPSTSSAFNPVAPRGPLVPA